MKRTLSFSLVFFWGITLALNAQTTVKSSDRFADLIGVLKNKKQQTIDFTREILDIDENHRKSVLKNEMSSLKKLSSFPFLDNAQYVEFHSKCRRAVRLANSIYGYYNKRYISVLDELRDLSWKVRDTLWAATIELECNQLKQSFKNNPERISLEDCENPFVSAQLSRHEDLSYSCLEMVWPAAFLFGRDKTATKLLVHAGRIESMRLKDSSSAFLHFLRSCDWSSKEVNEFNELTTQLEIIYGRKKYREIRDSLVDTGDFEPLLTYKCDFSERAREIREKFLPTLEFSKSRDVVSGIFYREMGACYYVDGKYDYAAYYLRKALNDFGDSYLYTEDDSSTYINTAYLLGKIYERWGNVRMALELYQKAYKFGTQDPFNINITTLGSIIAYARLCVKHDKIRSALASLSIFDAYYNDKTTYTYDYLIDDGHYYKSYRHCLRSLDAYYFLLKAEISIRNNAPPEDYFSQVETIIRENDLAGMWIEYEFNHMQARYQIRQKNYSKARRFIEPTLTRTVVRLPDRVDAMLLNAQICSLEGDKVKQVESYKNAFNSIREYIVSYLFSVTNNNRIALIEDIGPQLQLITDSCISLSSSFPKAVELLYDNALFRKGLLLQSSNTVKYAVYNTGDQKLIGEYETLIRHENQDVQTYAASSYYPDYDAFLRVHELNGKSVEQYFSEESARQNNLSSVYLKEIKLLNNEKVWSQIQLLRKRFSSSWEDVSKYLKSEDAAIEFISSNKKTLVYSVKSFREQYYALILTPRNSPVLIPVDLGAVGDIQDFKWHSSFWNQLRPYLGHCENIYFSPTGIMHTLPLEYGAKGNGGNSLKDYKFFRVSSTKALIPEYPRHPIKSAAIYGGLQFDMSLKKLIAENKQYKGTVSLQRGVLRDEREYFETLLPLKGTLKEANDIINIMEGKNIKVFPYIGESGTETSFKSLEKKDIGIIHIGTHGFFNSEDMALKEGGFESISSEEMQMNRSGLYMAGANNFILDNIDESYDDGTLTASEISSLDLRNLDLVTLSACETGLGSVSSEGVFGLQRGFKKAGANTIIMSLWKVDDDATCLLMTEFYRNLMSGGTTKLEALQKAQETVRSRKGWESPKYWGAFIMLDGLY